MNIGRLTRLRTKFGEGHTATNSMFLQWCRDVLILSFIFVQRLVLWDRTRLRKGTTAETQTLATILPTDNFIVNYFDSNLPTSS